MRWLASLRKTYWPQKSLAWALTLAAATGAPSCSREEKVSPAAAKSERYLERVQANASDQGMGLIDDGFRADPDGNGSVRLTAEDLVGAPAKGRRLFQFEAPAGFASEFGGDLLVAPWDAGACVSQYYTASEPSFLEVGRRVRDMKLCGNITFAVCIKVSPLDRPGQAFARTPSFQLELPPCSPNP